MASENNNVSVNLKPFSEDTSTSDGTTISWHLFQILDNNRISGLFHSKCPEIHGTGAVPDN
jgi:hypothetical protein